MTVIVGNNVFLVFSVPLPMQADAGRRIGGAGQENAETGAGWHRTCWYGSDGKLTAGDVCGQASEGSAEKFFRCIWSGTDFACMEVNPSAARRHW